jgi:hypothetical protein
MVPIVPERLLDSRKGLGYQGGKLFPDWSIDVQVSGEGITSVPGDAEAVVLNVTGVDATAAGHVTVWPCAEARNNTSNLNLTAGQTAPNLVISRVGVGGKVCLYTKSSAHLLADLTGFHAAGSEYESVVPERLLDTRKSLGYWGAMPAAGQVVELQITGVDAAAAGHVTVWPCGEARPNTSNLNLLAGETVPNAVIAKIGDGGSVCLYTKSSMHLLADIVGYQSAA